MKLRLFSTCLAAALLTLSSQSRADVCTSSNNLIANCGFETGDFTGWTLTGNDVPDVTGNLYGVEGTDPDGTAPHSGTSQAYFGDLVPNATTLSQTITTVANGTYKISFWIAQDATPDSTTEGKNELLASFGGSTIASFSNIGVEPYTLVSVTGVATSPSTVFSITLGDGLGYMQLDDVQVTRVPEPATMPLMAVAALGMGLSTRRRQKQK